MRKFDKVYPSGGGTWQRIINERRWERMRRKKLPQHCPIDVGDRFTCLAQAAWYRTYRLTLFSAKLAAGELIMGYTRDEWLRLYHLQLNAAKGCDKPRLP